jgi:hypothetical protein
MVGKTMDMQNLQLEKLWLVRGCGICQLLVLTEISFYTYQETKNINSLFLKCSSEVLCATLLVKCLVRQFQ